MCMCNNSNKNERKGSMGVLKGKKKDLKYVIPSNSFYHGIRTNLILDLNQSDIETHNLSKNKSLKSELNSINHNLMYEHQKEIVEQPNEIEIHHVHHHLSPDEDSLNKILTINQKSNLKEVLIAVPTGYISIPSMNYARMVWGILFTIVIGIIIGLVTGISFICTKTKYYSNKSLVQN